MSEQKTIARPARTGFMAELDQWTDDNVLRPLFATDPNQEDWENVEELVKRAIREKVLQSYRNGQAAGPRPPRKTPQR